MQQKTIARKSMRMMSYRRDDKPSSVGALWLTALVVALFWAAVVFSNQDRIMSLIAQWLP